MTIDPETAPLLAQVTAEGHHIGASDEQNFEYGLECILDHAGRLIERSPRRSPRTKAAAQERFRRDRPLSDANARRNPV